MPSESPSLPDQEPDGGSASPALQFEEVYDAHADYVRCNVRRLGVSEAFADDATQKVFLIVHRRLHEFEHRSSIRTWLLSIALLVVREERRTIRRRLAHWWRHSNVEPDELPAVSGATPFEAYSQAEACATVQALLETLSPDKREVFVLAELEELTAPEIAELTGLTQRAVYSRLRAARRDFERAASRVRRAERLGTR